jgi:RHS repeat-associated protein
MHKRLKHQLKRTILILTATIFARAAAAQGVASDPPNAGAAGGAQSVAGIESVNGLNGNLNITIPVASLPPGPGGSGASVKLVYNSAIFDLSTQVPATGSTVLQTSYVPSTHGGGWSYSFRYTLWSQTRLTEFTSATCSAVSNTEADNWYKTILTTPDGSNHVLRLVSAIDQNNNPIGVTALSSDATLSFSHYDFSGNNNHNCGISSSSFSGKLIYVTADSSYIRVEADTVLSVWTAYLPDGSRVSGPIIAPANPTTHDRHAVDSDASDMRDRNGNAISLSGNCTIGNTCTETITDARSRTVTISFGSNPNGTWQDSIAWTGVNGSLTTLINWTSSTPAPLPYYCQTTPTGTVNTGGICTLSQNESVVTSIQLPATADGVSSTYQFQYTQTTGNYSWGELHHITYCTGSTTCQAQWQTFYIYAYDNQSSLPGSALPSRPPGTAVNPLSSKTLSYGEFLRGMQTPISETTQYYAPMPPSVSSFNLYNYPLLSTSTNVSEVLYPDGSYSETFTANYCPSDLKLRDLCIALPYETINRDGSTTEMLWASHVPAPGVPNGAMFNPYVQTRVTKGLNALVASVVEVDQDPFGNGNTTQVREYSWVPDNSTNSEISRTTGQVTSACTSSASYCTTPQRTSTASFSLTSPYWTPGLTGPIRNPQSVTTGGTSTAFTYDGNGNPISATRAGVTTSSTYDSTGNPLTFTDGNGNTTQITYGLTGCPGLYPSNVATPGSGQTDYTYDCARGTLLSVKTHTGGSNFITTTPTYDNLGRTTQITQAAGSLTRTTKTTYDDVGLSIKTEVDLTSSTKATTYQYFDAIGRTIATIDAAGNRTEKAYRYGSNGLSYEITSNPYQSLSDPTMGWTLTINDTGVVGVGTSSFNTSRKVISYSGQNLPQPWTTEQVTSNGTVTSVLRTNPTNPAYPALTNCPGPLAGMPGPGIVTTDEAGNQRVNCMDALGQLAAVLEPDGMLTSYGYDALGNLSGVSSQCIAGCGCSPAGSTGQVRSFTYDALSRLITSVNPESGTVTFGYDSNGNLLSRTDALNTVKLFYDTLDRPLGKCYGAGVCNAQSANVTYTYDSDFQGALSSVSYGGHTQSFTHDAFGRITGSTQTTPSPGSMSYSFLYQYNLSDQLTQMTYPSGRAVNYTLNAAGQTTALGGTLGSVVTPYASSMSYSPAGDATSLTFGNNVMETRSFNNRFQQTQITAGSLLNVNYAYCDNRSATCTNGNTGSPWSQTIQANGQPSATQQYRHDALNRIIAAEERTGLTDFTPSCPGTNSVWCQSFQYDRTGNRGLTWSVPSEQAGTPYAFDPATNRITTAGFGYDAVGNLIQVPFNTQNNNAAMAYDAENRMVTFCPNQTAPCVAQTASGKTVYVYDGLGNRVQKIDGNGNVTTFVYDAFGNLAAEYGSGGQPGTSYVTVDALASARLVMGMLMERHDFQSYGTGAENTGWRASVSGYGVNGLREQYTGQARDAESNLDWFHARFYSPIQGRFVGVDPDSTGANPSDPQTWNGYAYVGNNPLTYTDPTGECWWCTLLGVGLDIAGIFTGGTSTILGSILTTAGTIATGGGLGGDIIGAISGGVNSGPWNEQLPIGGGLGGGLNTGNVFGSGNTGPFIFSANPADCGQNGCPAPTLAPDFTTINFSIGFPWFGWSPTITRDRYGRWYYSATGATVGKSLTIVSGSLTFNYLNHWMNTNYAPNPTQLNNFLTGHGWSLSGGVGAGFSETCSPGNGCATGWGFFSPQAGAAYNYTFEPKSIHINRRHPRPLFFGHSSLVP